MTIKISPQIYKTEIAMSRWFRAYSETLHDPKIQMLPLESFKAWHNALYLACQMNSQDGNIGTIENVSFAFHETKNSVSFAFQPLIDSGLIVTNGETFQIVSWRKRQYKSDTSTERVRKHRQKMKRSGNDSVTVPYVSVSDSVSSNILAKEEVSYNTSNAREPEDDCPW